MVFQSYAIWPHMTVAENVAFGLKLKKLPKEDVAKRVEPRARDGRALAGYGERGASQLSGGQQQRVALARAIVLEPRRAAVRRAAQQSRRQAARAHALRAAPAAAAARHHVGLCDARPAGGDGDRRPRRADERRRASTRSARRSTSISARPSRFGAEFIGLANIIEATVVANGATTRVRLPGGIELDSAMGGHAPNAKVDVMCRPEDLRVSAERRRGRTGSPPRSRARSSSAISRTSMSRPARSPCAGS